MLYDEIKSQVKKYLANLAKENETACAVYDSAKESSETNITISQLEELLKGKKTKVIRELLQTNLKALKAKQKDAKPAKDSKPIVAFVQSNSKAIYGVVPLTKDALQYETGKGLQRHVSKVADAYGMIVTKTRDNYVIFQANLTKKRLSKFNFKEFQGVLEKYNGAQIVCEQLTLDSILDLSAEEDVKAEKKKPAEDLEKKAEKPTPRRQRKSKPIKIPKELAKGELGYFTAPQAAEAVGRSIQTIHNWINNYGLRAKKVKVPGGSRKQTVVTYEALLKFCEKDQIERFWEKDEVIEDIAEGHSELYLMAWHGISKRQLNALRRKLGTDQYTGEDSKKTGKKKVSDAEIRAFFEKNGISRKAFDAAKKAFPGVNGRRIQGNRLAVQRYGKNKKK